MDFRGFDSSIILMVRGGIARPIGDFLENMSHAILVMIILVGRLGVKENQSKAVRLDSSGTGGSRWPGDKGPRAT